MSKIIKDNLKEDYFTKEKTNILINDKKVDVYNYEMYVSKDELNKLISNIYKSIISNNNLMTALSNISKQSKEVLIEKLEKFCDTTEKSFLEVIDKDGIIGSIGEIYDTIEPYSSKGTPAQAWSVAEVYRIILRK